jgi:hypothetical protein
MASVMVPIDFEEYEGVHNVMCVHPQGPTHLQMFDNMTDSMLEESAD